MHRQHFCWTCKAWNLRLNLFHCVDISPHALTLLIRLTGAGKGSHKKQSPPYDDGGADDHSDVEDAEDYRKGAHSCCLWCCLHLKEAQGQHYFSAAPAGACRRAKRAVQALPPVVLAILQRSQAVHAAVAHTYCSCTACRIAALLHAHHRCSHAGGYHPVYVGEKFKQGRYVVLKKLGWGHFSTVWLVLDTTSHTFAALKVRSSSRSGGLPASMQD